MALRGLCAGLKATLRRSRACQGAVSSVLGGSDFALLRGHNHQSLLLPSSLAKHLSQRDHFSFAAQAQALAEAALPEPAPSVYRIVVVTGDVRGAGTQAPAIVTLHGESGGSSDYVVGDEQDENGFERGSSKKYELSVEKNLGVLKRIHVEQCEPSVTDTGSGWFLDQIAVTGPDGQTVVFPCHSWIGKNDAGDISGKGAKTQACCKCASVATAEANNCPHPASGIGPLAT